MNVIFYQKKKQVNPTSRAAAGTALKWLLTTDKLTGIRLKPRKTMH